MTFKAARHNAIFAAASAIVTVILLHVYYVKCQPTQSCISYHYQDSNPGPGSLDWSSTPGSYTGGMNPVLPIAQTVMAMQTD